MAKRYVVYKHTAPNGKSYIGITCQKPSERWGVGGRRYARYNKHFYSAIQKYGWDSFSHDVLAGNLSGAEAKEIEQNLILLLDTQNPDKGYNQTAGGDGVKHLAAEARRRIGAAQETAVNQYSINGEYIGSFKSQTEAARQLGSKSGPSLCRALNGKQREWAGYQWRFDTGENRLDIPAIVHKPLYTAVVQYSMSGEKMAEYDRVMDAARAVNGYWQNISKCCRGKKLTAYGYVWRYAA